MSATEGLKVGKAVFDILKNDASVMAANLLNSDTTLIQPVPLSNKINPDIAIAYQVDSVNPINVKRLYRSATAPLYIVDFSCACLSRNYGDSVKLADTVTAALQSAETDGTYGGIKVNGITLLSATEDYNEKRRYYIKDLSFQARVLL